VYDAANPGSTTFESKFYLQSYLDYANQLFVETLDATHCRVYICGVYTGKRGLAIVDVNLSVNPATFTYRGTCSMDTTANQVYVLGNYAYVATGQGIQVIDVTNPAAPSLCCTFEASKSVTDLTIVGSTLNAMVNNKGLYRYDIPDPGDPGAISLQRVYDEVIDGCFAVSGDYAYVSNPLEGQGGLTIVYVGDELFDFSDRPYLEYGEYVNYQNIADFEVCDDLVYAAIRTQGLETIRVVPPATFQRLGSDDIPSVGGKVGVKVVGDRAFLADSAYGLHVLDVTDPSTPTEIGGLPATFRSRQDWMKFCQVGLEIVGDYVFLPDFDGGILVADVSDPQDIAKLDVIPMISNTFEVVAQGTVLYAAAYSSGLHAFDITVPENPHKLSTYYEGGDAMGLDVEDETVYLAAFDRSVDIIDYSTPAQPAIVGRYDWPVAINWGWIVAAIDVDKVGSYAFVSQFEVGIAAIDVSDPIRPYLQGSWQTPPGDFYQRKTSTVYVSDSFIYAGGIRDDTLKPVLATYKIQVRE
jgi:hypothetical protein